MATLRKLGSDARRLLLATLAALPCLGVAAGLAAGAGTTVAALVGGCVGALLEPGAAQAQVQSERPPPQPPRADVEANDLQQLRSTVAALESRIQSLEERDARREQAQREAEQRVATLRQQLDEARRAVEAAESRLADQSGMIRRLDSERAHARRDAPFLERIEIRGAVATSYNFNFNNPDSQPSFGFPAGFGPGDNRPVYPQVKHNTFQLDQARLAIGSAPDDAEPAGFQLELLYGVSADPTGGSDTPLIQQAFVAWRPPMPGDVELRLGRWDSPVGAEIIYVGENAHASRGLVWSFQPFNHDGLLASGSPGHGFSWKLGVANNGGAANFDNNNAKTALGQLAWRNDRLDLRLTYMAEDGPLRGPFAATSSGRDEDISHLLDLVIFWDPSDRLTLWLNVDWIRTDFKGLRASDTIGVALAGRLALTRATGVALRTEWARLASDEPGVSEIDAVWLTGTVDHALSERLTLRGELLWYGAFRHSGPDTFFVNGAGTARTKRQQAVAILQAIYFF